MVKAAAAARSGAVPPVAGDAGAVSGRAASAGLIVLARHGEPALSRRVRLSADGYRRWWAAYEAGGILPDQTPPSGLLKLAGCADLIFASTRKRALETAAAVAQGKPFVSDSVFVEAPLPPPALPSFVKMKPRTWGFWARLVWYFGHSEGQETRRQAEQRADAAAERLIEAATGGATVLVLAHGFFNLMIGRALKRRGWRQLEGRGYTYWATRRFVPA
jgi:broad specificity phosphatase PhoE